jgi:UDP-glucose 4-epimerase
MGERSSSAVAVVTGGAGAIGSALVARLLADGGSVRVLDNFSSGRREALPAPSERLRIVPFDLSSEELPLVEYRGASEVWHLAANPDIRLGTQDPTVDLRNGTLATFHVLESARRADVPRVLFSSSSVVYGLASAQPTPESYGPLLPESQYAASKLAAEGLMSAYAHSYGLKSYIFRFANIIDGRMNHGILFDFFAKLRRDPQRLEVLGDGRQAKSYLRTEECLDGMFTARQHASASVNVYNLGAVDQISVREIAEKVVAAHGGEATVVFTGGSRGWVGDVPLQLLALDRIRGLGWSPKLTSAQAVDRTIEELRSLRPAPSPRG